MSLPLTARERELVLNSYSGNSSKSAHKWIYSNSKKNWFEVRIHNEFRAKFKTLETALKFRDMILDDHPEYFRSTILEKYKDSRTYRTKAERGPCSWSSMKPIINNETVIVSFN